jgi:hypothetical protein
MSVNLEQILLQTPSSDGFDFHPGALIRSVNALHPLGKDKALNVVEAFVRNHTCAEPSDGMSLVLRCLFEVPNPPGYMPPFEFRTQWLPPEPADPRLFPRIPLVILEDIPFMLVRDIGVYGGPGCGSPMDPIGDVQYFRNEGRLRDKMLTPTNDPLSAFARLESLPQWLWGKRYHSRIGYDRVDRFTQPASTGQEQMECRELIRPQLLRLLSSALGFGKITGYQKIDSLMDISCSEVRWQKMMSELSRLRLRWDAGRQDYVR